MDKMNVTPVRVHLPILFLVMFAIISSVYTIAEASQSPSTQLHAYLRQGIEKALNLDMQSACNYLRKARDLDGENPLPHAFLALSDWSSYEMSYDPKDREKHQRSMTNNINEALVKGGKRIEKNSKDAQAYFAMALAKFAKARLEMEQKHHFTVMYEASQIWEYCEKVRKENPQDYDVYFPIGLVHYHLDQLNYLSRFISNIFMTNGDRRKGLQELEMAANRSHLFKELALAELVLVYTNYEHQPERALPIARKLKESFPGNYNFSFALANILSDLHRFEEAFSIARDLERGILSGQTPYGQQIKSRYDQLMGRILFEQGEYDKASGYFQKVITDSAPSSARSRAGALLHLGMIYDLNKERNKALDCYSRTLTVSGGEGVAQIEARKYLKSPYQRNHKIKTS
jgi:tetratricopeptide (TPR) repeat protein